MLSEVALLPISLEIDYSMWHLEVVCIYEGISL